MEERFYLSEVPLPAHERREGPRKGELGSNSQGVATRAATPGHRREEGRSFLLRHLQGVCERAHGVGVGTSPLATLQVAYALGAKIGLLGQFLLRETCGLPQSP